MSKSIGIRILLFIPTLFVLSICLFGLQESARGDQVASLCGIDGTVDERVYLDCIKTYNLDQAAFYISVSPQFVDAEVLRTIFPAGKKQTIEQLAYQTRDWDGTIRWMQLMDELIERDYSLQAELQVQINALRSKYWSGLSLVEFQNQLEQINHPEVDVLISQIQNLSTELTQSSPRFSDYLPQIDWNGSANRFHHWWSKAIVFEFGQSYSGRSVNALIKGAILRTLLLNLIAFTLAILLACSLVIWSSRKLNEQSRHPLDGWSSIFLAIPRFWLATVLIFLFANQARFGALGFFDIGAFTLTSSGISLIGLIKVYTLPILCLAFPITWSIYKHLRDKIKAEWKMPYVQSARAKGIPESKIIRQYVLPNSINPLLTIVGSLISRLLAGSIIIESIFAIPGLGGLLFDAFLSNDWPVLYALCFIAGVMTLSGYLLSDILYFIFDPKLRKGGMKYV